MQNNLIEYSLKSIKELLVDPNLDQEIVDSKAVELANTFISICEESVKNIKRNLSYIRIAEGAGCIKRFNEH